MTLQKRSRLGCLTCRRKKKKCNQQKPSCELCTKTNSPCEWPVIGQEYRNKRRNPKPRFVNYSLESTDAATLDTPISPPEMSLITMSPNSQLNFFVDSNLLDNDPFSPTFPPAILYETPKLPLVLSLNTSELEFFEYYCQHVALEISIVPKKYNYFLKVFLPMAHENEAILRSLVAWGCVLRAKNEGLPNGPGLILIELAKRCILNQKENFIASLTSYVILMCIKITTGSTFDWSGYLTNCYDLINDMGGFKVLKDYSKEGKILAQNFAYFDILASQSNENGTYYPVSEYDAIFNMDTNTIDPLLGCTKPLILILGDIINLVVEYSLLDDTVDDYYDKLESIVIRTSVQEQKLRNANILHADYKLLQEGEEITFHEQMFELYVLTIQMYVKQSLGRLPSMVPEIQVMVRKANILIDRLIDSPLKSGLCFPLLIAGVNSVTEEDKLRTYERLIHMKNNHGFESIDKIRFIVKEVWDINGNGMFCVDYFRVTKHFGWKLNIGR